MFKQGTWQAHYPDDRTTVVIWYSIFGASSKPLTLAKGVIGPILTSTGLSHAYARERKAHCSPKWLYNTTMTTCVKIPRDIWSQNFSNHLFYCKHPDKKLKYNIKYASISRKLINEDIPINWSSIHIRLTSTTV